MPADSQHKGYRHMSEAILGIATYPSHQLNAATQVSPDEISRRATSQSKEL